MLNQLRGIYSSLQKHQVQIGSFRRRAAERRGVFCTPMTALQKFRTHGTIPALFPNKCSVGIREKSELHDTGNGY